MNEDQIEDTLQSKLEWPYFFAGGLFIFALLFCGLGWILDRDWDHIPYIWATLYYGISSLFRTALFESSLAAIILLGLFGSGAYFLIVRSRRKTELVVMMVLVLTVTFIGIAPGVFRVFIPISSLVYGTHSFNLALVAPSDDGDRAVLYKCDILRIFCEDIYVSDYLLGRQRPELYFDESENNIEVVIKGEVIFNYQVLVYDSISPT